MWSPLRFPGMEGSYGTWTCCSHMELPPCLTTLLHCLSWVACLLFSHVLLCLVESVEELNHTPGSSQCQPVPSLTQGWVQQLAVSASLGHLQHEGSIQGAVFGLCLLWKGSFPGCWQGECPAPAIPPAGRCCVSILTGWSWDWEQMMSKKRPFPELLSPVQEQSSQCVTLMLCCLHLLRLHICSSSYSLPSQQTSLSQKCKNLTESERSSGQFWCLGWGFTAELAQQPAPQKASLLPYFLLCLVLLNDGPDICVPFSRGIKSINWQSICSFLSPRIAFCQVVRMNLLTMQQEVGSGGGE